MDVGIGERTMKRRTILLTLAVLSAVMANGKVHAKGRGGSGSRGRSSKSGRSSNYRSAKSGRYIKKGYANKHPSTTVKEKRK